MTNTNLAKPSRREAIAGAAALGLAAALPARAAMDGTLYEVEIRNFRFSPASLSVAPGDRVRWTNRDRAAHNASAADRSWRTATLRRNDSAEITVTADMATEYICSIHPRMKASLVISAA